MSEWSDLISIATLRDFSVESLEIESLIEVAIRVLKYKYYQRHLNFFQGKILPFQYMQVIGCFIWLKHSMFPWQQFKLPWQQYKLPWQCLHQFLVKPFYSNQ